MNDDVGSLYGVIQQSSGQNRQTQLRSLWNSLSTQTQTPEVLLLGLKQPSNDVRRLVLDALAASSTTTEKFFVIAILDVIRLNLQDSPTSLSAIRTTSSGLKAMTRLLRGGLDIPLNSFDVQSLVEILLAAMAWGLAALPSKAESVTRTKTWRGTTAPGSAFTTFERRESQSSNWRGPSIQASSAISTAPLQKKSSSASLRSEISTTSTSYLARFDTDQSAASEGETEADARGGEGDNLEMKQRRIRESGRIVRQRSIACISLLNEGNGKLLLIHWPRLLLDAEGGAKSASLMDVGDRDESISCRVAALHAIQAIIATGSQAGFLAGAEERSRLSAFTSLSSRMASIIVDMRRRLLLLLQDSNTSLTLLDATLKCTRTLVQSTPQVKLRVSHSQMLRETTLKLCSRPEVASAVPAYSLLSALIASERRGGEGSTSDSIITTLEDPNTPAQVQVEAWNTMTALAEKDAIQKEEKNLIPRLLQSAVSANNPLEVRQAIATFVQACKMNKSVNVGEEVVEQLCLDESPIVRSIAANCLFSGQTQEERLMKLMQDIDSTVRASAVRAVGVNVAQENRTTLEDATFLLLRDQSLLVRMRASWTLGNLCETSDRFTVLLSHCLLLKGDDERIEVNAIRGLGAVLARCPTSMLEQCLEIVEASLAWLLSALQTGSPKVRWNASASLARALTLRSTGHYLLSSTHSHLLPVVLAKVVVEDKTFKVRLSAVNALLILAERNQLQTRTDFGLVQKAIDGALQNVGDQIKQASFKEAQLHALPLQQSLEKLSVMLKAQD